MSHLLTLEFSILNETILGFRFEYKYPRGSVLKSKKINSKKYFIISKSSTRKMEFPDLGRHCMLKDCNRLDFLPVKCRGCSKVYCIDHYNYKDHACPNAPKENRQVPTCPLCSKPVPFDKDLSLIHI